MAKVKIANPFTILLLVLFSTLTYAARPEPAFANASPAKTQVDNVAEHDCRGRSDEECLMRRTLAAHTDYIYTQNVQRLPGQPQSYVVYLGEHSHGPELSSVDLNQVTKSHREFLGSFLGSDDNPEDVIFHSHINGFAAKLDDAVAARIAKHPKVVSVFLKQARKLQTTHRRRINKARHGEDTSVENLDTENRDKEFGQSKAKISGSKSKPAPSESYRDQHPSRGFEGHD